MACFSIILHTFAYIRLKKPSCHDNQYSTSPHQKKANKNRWGAHAVLLWLHAGWGLCFYIKDYQGNVRVVLNQRMLDCEGDEVQDIKKAIKVEWYIRQNVEPYEERKIQTYP